ncbi:Uma2 family endonuclease [Nocardioides sp. L-11A]|uniref:Uma2 family endonuclease n=1 Tax=Nocardioides sp. L-11A TaxID=3043848 RepID=UPI00249C4EA9|nr:Uma2 family endonuclease [Nocardioides sp. L-11A]
MTLEAELGWAPRGPVTVADLFELPDEPAEPDGEGPTPRYELIDGMLIALAPADLRHVYIASRLWQVLNDAAPPGLWALQGPGGAIIDDVTWVEPDVFVTPRVPDRYFEGVPLLTVEVLSPSNRLYDLTTKFSRYERAGVPSYWILDPTELRLVAWELRRGRYVEVADVGADQAWTATAPFEVTVRPGALLD